MVESMMKSLIAWFSLPESGLSTVFVVSFVSATLLPLGSEPAVFGYAKLNPSQFWLVVGVATVGNTLGGIVNYWLGYGAKKALAEGRETRYLRWFERMGPRLLFFSFLPAVGDPICTVAGWLRLPFWSSVGWMAIGKLLRYVVMTAALLWIPNAFWHDLLKLIAG